MARPLGPTGGGDRTLVGGGVNLLAIESATDLVGAALIADDGTALERSHRGGRAHAEQLAPAIADVCAASGLTVGDVDAIAVDVGPGLFTGLRVGVATAKALAQALGLGVLGVSSLDVLAAAVADRLDLGIGPGTTVVAVVDARRGEVFAARYGFIGYDDRAGKDEPGAGHADPADARVHGPVLMRPDALAASLADPEGGDGGPIVMVGDGVARYRELFDSVPSVDLTFSAALTAPSPLALAQLALRRLEAGAVPSAPGVIVPDYRREADARINWEQRIPAHSGSGGIRPAHSEPGLTSEPGR